MSKKKADEFLKPVKRKEVKEKKVKPREIKINLFDPLPKIQEEIERMVNGNRCLILGGNQVSKNKVWYLIGRSKSMEVVTNYTMSMFQPVERREVKDFFVLGIIKVGDFNELDDWFLLELRELKCPIHIVNSINAVKELFKSL